MAETWRNPLAPPDADVLRQTTQPSGPRPAPYAPDMERWRREAERTQRLARRGPPMPRPPATLYGAPDGTVSAQRPAPALKNPRWYNNGASRGTELADEWSKARQIINGTYEPTKAPKAPGAVSRAVRGARAAFNAAPEAVEGVRPAGVLRRGAAAVQRAASGAWSGATTAAEAAPPATAKATRLARLGVGGGRLAAGLGRIATPLTVGYGAVKSGTMSNEDRARFNDDMGVTSSSSVAGDLANNTANVAFNVGNALTGGYAEKLGNALGSYAAGGGFGEGWNRRTFDDRGQPTTASTPVTAANASTPNTAASASTPNTAPTPEERRLKTNAELEGMRKGFAAQAPGVGNVNLGAGAGYGGGGLKRNSLASSIGKFGEPVYDNRSISRMLARNAGPGGWTTDNLADSEAARDIALRRRPSPGTTDSYASAGGADGAGSTGARRTLGGGQSGASFGSGGGFRGQGSDPQAREVRGDLYGADSERRAGIANLDAAIKSLVTENGGLNMRSKRELYGQLLRQRSEMSGMPYGVQNERDLRGAQMANEMANNNANRGIERDKLAWDQDKFGQEMALKRRDSNAQSDYLKMLQEDAKAQRESKEFAYGEEEMRDGKASDRLDADIARIMSAQPEGAKDYTAARQQALQNIATRDRYAGLDPARNVVGREAEEGELAFLRGIGRQHENTWFGDLFRGGGFHPFNSESTDWDTIDPARIEVGRDNGAISGLWDFGTNESMRVRRPSGGYNTVPLPEGTDVKRLKDIIAARKEAREAAAR